MSRFDKLLLSELRIIESKEMLPKASKGDLEKAFIDNENLKALGYELTYESIIRLARDYKANPDMKSVCERVQEFEPEIEVSPMYPNFPKQVMEMDELTFRTHQLMHYVSTYGLEAVLGIEIEEGWLPKTEEIEGRVEDEQVVDLKTIEYLSIEEVDSKIINSIIGKKERLQSREIEIAKVVLLRTNAPIEDVPFKENIGLIYGDLLLEGVIEERYRVLYALVDIVKHPGDVLDLTEYMVVKNRYKHFKTSVKRGLVDLIEQFSDAAIEENLASNRWSNKFLGKGGKPRSINRNIALIDYLSFNRFSKNKAAQEIVKEMKDGELLSWNQNLEKAYKSNDKDLILKLISQRPGIMFRQINRLIKNGIEHDNIVNVLSESASQLKTQSIVSALNNFEGDIIVDKIFLSVLANNLAGKNIEELKGRSVYINEEDVDFARSKLEITEKFKEGGYISNGMAIRIPEALKYLRFFTYWNDERRIDIDLHGTALDKDDKIHHIGWHGRYKNDNLTYSGDITESDATEYIDLDVEGAIKDGFKSVQFNINSYTGVPFVHIDTVFTGLMGLSKMGEKGEQVSIFDPKNVLFRHDLESKHMAIDYGMIDLENRLIYVGGKARDYHNDYNAFEIPKVKLSIKSYIELLILAQGGTITDNKEDADVVLGLAKSDEDNYVSLIDNNFYMDC